MADDILAAARALRESLVADRRDIHAHPELAFQEERTAAKVASRLAELGIEHQTGVGQTGVVGLMRGSMPGKTVLLRADMDALPIDEVSERPYASQNQGVMHACGHDGHTAMLLAAARLLNERRDAFAGNVKLMFQPAEEGGHGALRMIEAGLLEDPKVDAAFAQHVMHYYKTGVVGVGAGPLWATSDRFVITVQGHGGHAARPDATVDPIVIAAHITTALQTIVSREVPSAQQAVITVGSIHAGAVANVIPDTAVMRGTFRVYDPELQAFMRRRIEEVARGIAAAMRAKADVEHIAGYPPLVNHESGAILVRAAVESLGLQAVEDRPSMGAEDFSYVLQRVPGAMLRLGIRHVSWAQERPIHNSSFDLDEDALPLGTAVLTATALRYLSDA